MQVARNCEKFEAVQLLTERGANIHTVKVSCYFTIALGVMSTDGMIVVVCITV